MIPKRHKTLISYIDSDTLQVVRITIVNTQIQRALKMMSSATGLRMKPSFFIVGAQKSGTTSLFQYIVDLADNFAEPERKELYFFTEHFQKGKTYYQSKFPMKQGKGIITGEATPDYLYSPLVPKRVAGYYPDAKIVIILRDPVLRAYSQYQFQNNTEKTQGRDDLSFAEAIATEESRYSAKDAEDFAFSYKYHSYKARGRYAEQIKRWQQFYSPEQMLILELGDLNENPQAVIEQLFNFLGLTFKQNIQYAFKPSNTGPSSIPPIDPQTKQELVDYFRPLNEELFELLGKEFPWLK